MTTILFSTNPVPVEVTYDSPSLFVAMTVFKWNGTEWAQFGVASAVALVDGLSTYGSMFTPPDASPYIVILMPYEDGTFSVPDTNYSPSSRSFVIDPSIGQIKAIVGQSLAFTGVLLVENTSDILTIGD
jgi:hypothetical protein